MEARAKVLPTLEEFNSWLTHPVTGAVRAYLEEQVAQAQVDWVNGVFTGASMEETVQLNSEAIGRVRALALISSLEYGDLEGSL